MPSRFKEDSALKGKEQSRIDKIPEETKERFKYIWVVYLKDGEEIHEYDKEGNDGVLVSLDGKLVPKSNWYFVLQEEANDNVKSGYWIPVKGGKAHGVELKTGERLVMFRRSAMTLSKKYKGTIYAVGVRRTVGGKQIKEFRFIDKDGKHIDNDDSKYTSMGLIKRKQVR